MVYLTMPKINKVVYSGISSPLCIDMGDNIHNANNWVIENNEDGTFCLYIITDRCEPFEPEGKHQFSDPAVIGKGKSYLYNCAKELLGFINEEEESRMFSRLKFVFEGEKIKVNDSDGYLSCWKNCYNDNRYDLVISGFNDNESLQSFKIVE
jgi:hypothetical protein